jgi:hypothetical protein
MPAVEAVTMATLPSKRRAIAPLAIVAAPLLPGGGGGDAERCCGVRVDLVSNGSRAVVEHQSVAVVELQSRPRLLLRA